MDAFPRAVVDPRRYVTKARTPPLTRDDGVPGSDATVSQRQSRSSGQNSILFEPTSRESTYLESSVLPYGMERRSDGVLIPSDLERGEVVVDEPVRLRR